MHEGSLEKDGRARLDVLQGKDAIASERGLTNFEPVVAEQAIRRDLHAVIFRTVTSLKADVTRISVEVGRKAAEARLDWLPDISLTEDGLGLYGLKVRVDTIGEFNKARGIGSS